MVISECISAYWNLDMCIGIIQIWKGDTCNINTYMSTMTLLTGQPWPVKQWRYYILQTLLHELGIFQRVTTSLTTAEWRNRIWYSRGLVLQFSAIIKKVSKRTNDAIKKWHSFFPIIALKAINSVLNHVTSYQSTRYLFSQVLLFQMNSATRGLLYPRLNQTTQGWRRCACRPTFSAPIVIMQASTPASWPITHE